MKTLQDYSFIHGVCHNWYGDEDEYRREISYAKRIGVNSFRTWLSPFLWQENHEKFLDQTLRFVRIANEYGISTMPILFNGNGLRIETLEPEFWKDIGDAYVKDVVKLLKDEPGLLMWDIMNEPSCNDYLMYDCPQEEFDKRWAKMNVFLRHYCGLVKELDPVNAITIGHTFARDLEPSAAWVDVLSFHDYLESTPRIEQTYCDAEKISHKYGKPLINSELSCVARANPYDLSIEMAYKHKVGFYVFELMIRGHWGGIHGLFYPDGTVRDPSAVAAMMGFFRKRTSDRIRFQPNQEGKVDAAIERLKQAYKTPVNPFSAHKNNSEEILEATEWIVNLLEASELVPMIDPPSARLSYYRSIPVNERNVDEIKRFSYEMAETLKKAACIL